LLVDEEILLLQTVLGWFFRQFMSVYGEPAAVQCFRRLAAFSDRAEFIQYRENLRAALGSHYRTRYELLLPFISPTDLYDIEVLAEGRNGRVFSASWDRPPLVPGGNREAVRVVLKHIHAKGKADEDSPLVKFLHEVPPLAVELIIDGDCSAGVE
jgi:hypothetical protein